MIANGLEEMSEMLSRVASWPMRDRITFARKILETVDDVPELRQRGYTAEEVVDLLKIPQPAPNDEECQKIIDDEIVRKYGS